MRYVHQRVVVYRTRARPKKSSGGGVFWLLVIMAVLFALAGSCNF